jgi:hypothetical protein
MPADSTYVDTSVLGAYYCPEPLSSAAESALLKLRDPCISPLTEVEFASLVARKRRLQGNRSKRCTSPVRSSRPSYFRRLPLGTEHFLRARDLIGSMASALSTLDALHLAVALSAGIPMLTADRDFARAARRHDASVILIK